MWIRVGGVTCLAGARIPVGACPVISSEKQANSSDPSVNVILVTEVLVVARSPAIMRTFPSGIFRHINHTSWQRETLEGTICPSGFSRFRGLR